MSQKLEFSEGGPTLEGLSFLTLKSRALRGRGDITLFIPHEARSLQNAPLVLLLHGAYGSHWNWSIMGGAHRAAQRLLREKRIPPLVLAMPSDGLWGDGSGYLTHPGQDFEKWIVEDVPRGTRAAAACVSVSSPIFLGGLSMGGFGALRIGAKYPGFCRGISVHSSITHFTQLLTYVQEDAASFGAPPEDLSVLETMLRHRQNLPPIRFDCGVEDELMPVNRQLHLDMEANGLAHRFEEFSGGHDWVYWSKHIEDSLLFFAEILAAPPSP